MKTDTSSRNIAQQQHRSQRDDFRIALRALLLSPLMNPSHEDFPKVRRHADALREWFSREAGWVLQIEREGARLYKRPTDLLNSTRGLAKYDRRRYILLCLACAVLERADPQITLRLLGDKLLVLAAEPPLAEHGFTFTLLAQHERRELVTICHTLLDLGVLQRVAGDEDGFIHEGGEFADALYDVRRRPLSYMLAAVRGPSTWPAVEAPTTLDERLHALVDEHVPDSDEGRRTALRHQLARQLLDDPVIYFNSLDTEAHTYFINQRGPMAARLCEATGLHAEQRAEGLALTDESGTLTDVAMPAEGTEAHVTLLVAEFLAKRVRELTNESHQEQASASPLGEEEIITFLRTAISKYGHYWRKSAREAGAERELTAIALERLEKLQLVERNKQEIHPLPALARFALNESEVYTSQDRLDLPHSQAGHRSELL